MPGTARWLPGQLSAELLLMPGDVEERWGKPATENRILGRAEGVRPSCWAERP